MDISLTYILLLIVVIFTGFLYNRYYEKINNGKGENYAEIQKYLLGTNEDLVKSKKPILWIHIVNEYNSRSWESFGSRSSFQLNQPYMYLTVKSIINKCSESFHICLIDDASIKKLLPNWSIDLTSISDPILENMRQLALVKILYTYGGIIVPPSFLCMQDLKDMYKRGTDNGKMFICETVNKNNHKPVMYPNIHFMGSKKENKDTSELIEYMQRIITEDYTAQSVFLGDFDRWTKKHKMNIINGKQIGTQTLDDEPVLIDDLLSNNYIQFYSEMYGIYIPSSDILNRRHYEWFARLSPQEVLESTTIIGKYMIIANIPNASIEPMKTNKFDGDYVDSDKLGYWSVPLGAPVWGLMPQNLGDKVRKFNKEPNFNG
jgi:hypothetical protein